MVIQNDAALDAELHLSIDIAERVFDLDHGLPTSVGHELLRGAHQEWDIDLTLTVGVSADVHIYRTDLNETFDELTYGANLS